MAEVIQLKVWQHPIDWDENRRQRLLHAYLASAWASEPGSDLDRTWLSVQIGRRPVSEQEWNTARFRAERILRAQGRRVLFVDQPPDDP